MKLSRSALLFFGISLCTFFTPFSARITAAETVPAQNPIQNSSPNTALNPVPTPVNAPRELFNGKDFTNWYKFIQKRGKNCDPLNVFSVRDGSIFISGEEYGCITTNEAFENYRLIVEMRWTCGPTYGSRKNSSYDSGILVHSIGKDGGYGGTWLGSLEVNLVEGGFGDFWVVYNEQKDDISLTANVGERTVSYGSVVSPDGKPKTIRAGRFAWMGIDPNWTEATHFRGKNDAENPVGEWNTIETVCDADTITVYVNGKLVNQGFRATPSAGKIQIQSEGAGLEVRRITILPLEK